jgi:hypothetical protein
MFVIELPSRLTVGITKFEKFFFFEKIFTFYIYDRYLNEFFFEKENLVKFVEHLMKEK